MFLAADMHAHMHRQASLGQWDEAERQLLAVKAPSLRAEAAHAAMLLRCLVHNGTTVHVSYSKYCY